MDLRNGYRILVGYRKLPWARRAYLTINSPLEQPLNYERNERERNLGIILLHLMDLLELKLKPMKDLTVEQRL